MILVTGATGKVGGQVVAQLHEAGVEARALARVPEAAGLPDGVEMVRGDLADPGSLDAALDGVDKVFLVWPTLAADAAAPEVVRRLAARARRVVYLSAIGAGTPGRGPVLDSHGRLERLIKESGAEWTFLRGGGFAGNDLAWAGGIRDGGVVREPFGGWRRSLVHEADLAAAGVRALLDDGHAGAVYELTGPQALSQAERVRIIGEVIGRPLRFEELSVEEARRQFLSWLPPEAVDATLEGMLEMTKKPEKVTRTVEQLTGRPALTYREWVVDHRRDFTG
ncbi:NAD(P)H-binding protein [Actinomadura montaniterrae]|uniref:NAD(P)H-binding protein n=1 Tax=Actinomadura montaniterrae TaxID=1803903 RepID=A0A6L3W516_9ACTN|nr:NAD(P)H-binding protein [Actinomadura montaniterrae]KAB2389944.1 NAD(P)H-binding protein [Actinomadura montaniterrae]